MTCESREDPRVWKMSGGSYIGFHAWGTLTWSFTTQVKGKACGESSPFVRQGFWWFSQAACHKQEATSTSWPYYWEQEATRKEGASLLGARTLQVALVVFCPSCQAAQ